MNGMRKFWFGVLTLLFVTGGLALAIWKSMPDELFGTYVWGVISLAIIFTGGNALEHASKVLETRFKKS